MLYFVSGAGGSGKSSILSRLNRALDFEWHEFDSVGVPNNPTQSWRLHTLEHWVARAADAGGDVGIVGQAPLGEVLAVPSAGRLDGIAMCLLDCEERERVRRLRERGAQPDQHMLNWAAWMRVHAQDPTWEQHVIVRDAPPLQMQWDRWTSLPADAESWRCPNIDTTHLSLDAVAERVVAWVRGDGSRL